MSSVLPQPSSPTTQRQSRFPVSLTQPHLPPHVSHLLYLRLSLRQFVRLASCLQFDFVLSLLGQRALCTLPCIVSLDTSLEIQLKRKRISELK